MQLCDPRTAEAVSRQQERAQVWLAPPAGAVILRSMPAAQTPPPVSSPRDRISLGCSGAEVTLAVVAGLRLLRILLGAAALWLLLWTALLMMLLGATLSWIAAPG